MKTNIHKDTLMLKCRNFVMPCKMLKHYMYKNITAISLYNLTLHIKGINLSFSVKFHYLVSSGLQNAFMGYTSYTVKTTHYKFTLYKTKILLTDFE